jgi:hypothetical protein
MARIRATTWLLGVALLTLAGCGTTHELNFRSPPGSWLALEDPDGQELGRVTFPGKLVLPQQASPGDAPTHPLRGHLRVNELIEEARIPSQARPYIHPDQGGAGINVKGWWQLFTYDRTPRDELAVHSVDVSSDALLELLRGQPVELEGKSPSGKPVWRLMLGLDVVH